MVGQSIILGVNAVHQAVQDAMSGAVDHAPIGAPMTTKRTLFRFVVSATLLAVSSLAVVSPSSATLTEPIAPTVSTRGDQPTSVRVDRFVGPQPSIPWSFAPPAKEVRKVTGLPVVRSGKGTAKIEDANYATVDFRVPDLDEASVGIQGVVAGIASAPTMRYLVRQYRQSGWKVVARSGWNVVMVAQFDFNPGVTEVIAMHPAHGYVATGQCLWVDEEQTRRVNQRKLVRCANSVARLVVDRPV